MNDLDLFDFPYRLRCGVELVHMAYDAYGSSDGCEPDRDGLYGIYLYLDSLCKELEARKEEA